MATKKSTKKSVNPVSKKPIVVVPNKLKTIKVPTKTIEESKTFTDRFEEMVDDIGLDTDDLPDGLIDDYDEFEGNIKKTLAKKNWLIWAAMFRPLIVPAMVRGLEGKPTVPQPKVTVQEPAPEPKQVVDFAQKYFEEHGLELCKSLTETDLANIKVDLKDNWGKGPNAFATAFKESYTVSEQRLQTIYRSEHHIAEYNGVVERAKVAGHQYKQWRAVGDERSCDVCMSYDMEIVPIEDTFSNGEFTATAHPNCRCSMVTLTGDDYDEMSDEEVRQDSAYDSGEEIKLNYKCPKGTVDDGFSCGNDNDSRLNMLVGEKLSEQLQSTLTESNKQLFALSNSEQTAINNYKHFNYTEINKYLRNNKNITNESLNNIKEIDNAFNKVSMPEDIVVYSGLRTIPNDVNLTKDNEFTVKEFTSSSILPQSSYRFANSGYMLEIEVPKGSKAVYVGSALNSNEKEVMINRDSKYKVISEPKTATIHNEFGDDIVTVVRVKLLRDFSIKHNSKLLEDAFNTIKLNYKCPKGTVDDSNSCGLNKNDKMNAPEGSRFSKPEEINSVNMVHSTKIENIPNIKKDGFKFSTNSMYGKGIYFSSKELSSYGSPMNVILLPHNQLHINRDIDVPKVINELGIDKYFLVE